MGMTETQLHSYCIKLSYDAIDILLHDDINKRGTIYDADQLEIRDFARVAVKVAKAVDRSNPNTSVLEGIALPYYDLHIQKIGEEKVLEILSVYNQIVHK